MALLKANVLEGFLTRSPKQKSICLSGSVEIRVCQPARLLRYARVLWRVTCAYIIRVPPPNSYYNQSTYFPIFQHHEHVLFRAVQLAP